MEINQKIKKQMNYLPFIWAFLGISVGSLLVNIVLGDTLLQEADSYNLMVLLEKWGQLNKNELFVFLLWKRGGVFFIYLICIYAIPKRGLKAVFLFTMSFVFGILFTSQIICNGIAGIYEVLLLLFPHLYIYMIGMYISLKQYLHQKYFAMLLILLATFLSGVLLESYINPMVLSILL